MTFVDGLGVGDVKDVALRDRRRLAEDGVLIVVATLAGANGTAADGAAGADRPRLRRGAEPLLDELRGRPAACSRSCSPTTSPRSSCSRSTCTTALGGVVYDRTRRRPMILPVLVEV